MKVICVYLCCTHVDEELESLFDLFDVDRDEQLGKGISILI